MVCFKEHAEGKSTVIILRANFFQTLFLRPSCSTGRLPFAISAPVGTLPPPAHRAQRDRAGGRARSPFPVGPDDLVRNPDVPLVENEGVDIGGMRATVVALRDDEKARRLRYEFDRDLDDPSFLWVIEKGAGTFEEQKLPAPASANPSRCSEGVKRARRRRAGFSTMMCMA